MQPIPRAVFVAIALGWLSFSLYTALLLFGFEASPVLGTYAILGAFALVLLALTWGLLKRSRLGLWIAIVFSAFGAYIALPNASIVPERAEFYVAQGLIQLTVLILLAFPSVHRAFRRNRSDGDPGAVV